MRQERTMTVLPFLLPRFPRRSLLMLICAALSSSAEAKFSPSVEVDECISSDADFCSCPPALDPFDDGILPPGWTDPGDVCLLPDDPPSTCTIHSSTTMQPDESTEGDLCSDGDHGDLRLLRSSSRKQRTLEFEPSKDLDDAALADGRELGFGDWGDGASWAWYFCGGGVTVPLTMTGWEPEIKALWMKRHAKTMIADVCSGKTTGSYGIGRYDSIWNLGVTWIGGFGLKMSSVLVGQVTKGGKCYKKYFVTVSFKDHFGEQIFRI
mmetsp:Transcript_60536/g.179417  ORF Transcript_60536/g.179417 Transcript_60536/m.179417 type:complete len:266 (-) Transcript_60536:254-1051(-)